MATLVAPAAMLTTSGGTATTTGPPHGPTPLCDTAALASALRPCLALAEPLPPPGDIAALFALAAPPRAGGVRPGGGWADLVYAPDPHRAVPEALAAYAALAVPHAPLTLIPPRFEAPLPPLTPATFEPAMCEPPPPALELFDLDEAWAAPRDRLARLAAACASAEAAALADAEAAAALEDFVREAGITTGIMQRLPPARAQPRHVLEYLLRALTVYRLDDPTLPPLPTPLPAPDSLLAAEGSAARTSIKSATAASAAAAAANAAAANSASTRASAAAFAGAGYRGAAAAAPAAASAPPALPAAAMAAAAASLSRAHRAGEG